ncbi:unnamed protein product [Gordionus sp. m RMFG-2023]
MPFKSDEFLNKVVLVTGASSGIGAVTAILFSKLGAKLSLTGRNIINLEKTSQDCENPIMFKAELTHDKDVENLVKETIKTYSKLDILINNAGILETGSIENTTLEQYDRLFNINVRSVYYLTMLSVPYLIESKGSIVNVSSVNGIRSFPGVLAYNMSKSALDQFTRCIALELASKNVRVNSVNPGVTLTELQKRGGLQEGEYNNFLEKSKGTHPMGRVANPIEVANIIAFLASENASFVTGVNMPVDGGRSVAGLR